MVHCLIWLAAGAGLAPALMPRLLLPVLSGRVWRHTIDSIFGYTNTLGVIRNLPHI
jgi:hypothetical protein